jgi:hypothetical protein
MRIRITDSEVTLTIDERGAAARCSQRAAVGGNGARIVFAPRGRSRNHLL